MYRRASGADAASSASVAGDVVGSVAARMLSGMSAGGAEAFGVVCGCAVCHGRGGRVAVGPGWTRLRAEPLTPATLTITTRAIGTTSARTRSRSVSYTHLRAH